MIGKLDVYSNSEVERKAKEVWFEVVKQSFDSTDISLCSDDDVLSSELADEGKLFLAQVCGYPLLLSPDSFEVLGIPSYSARGCFDKYFRSVVIVKNDSTIQSLHDLHNIAFTIATNGHTSLSGNLLLSATLGYDLLHQCNGRIIYTGFHEQSVLRVTDGSADIAGIDCVTFALFTKHNPNLLNGVRILGYTVAAPCCPYVTSKLHSPEAFNAIQASLADASQKIPQVVRDDLFLTSFTTSVESEDGVEEDSFVHLYDTYVRALQKQANLPSRYTLYTYDSPLEVLSDLLTPSVSVTDSKDTISNNTTYSVVTVPNEAPEREDLQALHNDDSVFINCLLDEIQKEALSTKTKDTANDTAKLTLDDRPAQYSVWSSYVRNGQPHAVRVLFPGGKEAAREFYEQKRKQSEANKTEPTPPTNIVCFLGVRKLVHLVSPSDVDVVRDCWAADAQIVANLNDKVIVAYATGEVQPGGDWGNVVVFHDGHSAESNLMLAAPPSSTSNTSTSVTTSSSVSATSGGGDITKCPHHTMLLTSKHSSQDNQRASPNKETVTTSNVAFTALNHNAHKTAIQDVSPWYYETVRIHRAAVVPQKPTTVSTESSSAATEIVQHDVSYIRTLSLRYTTSSVSLSDSGSDRLSCTPYSTVSDDGLTKSTILTSRKVIAW